MHVALNVAALRGIDVEEKRNTIANNLVHHEQYIQGENDILIFLEDGTISSVNSNQCTCVAASHNISCICVKAATTIADFLVPPVIDNNTDTGLSNSLPQDEQQWIKTKQQWQEIMDVINKTSSEETEKIKLISSSVQNLHSALFLNKYRKITMKRKIYPNCQYRKTMEKAKKKKHDTDHTYVPQKSNENTSQAKFKVTNRKRAARKNFS